MSEPLTKGMHDFRKLYWSIKFITNLVNLCWGGVTLYWAGAPTRESLGIIRGGF